eukprot:2907982-Prymnesium_polylepis.1
MPVRVSPTRPERIWAVAQGSEHRSLDSTGENPTAAVRVPAAYRSSQSVVRRCIQPTSGGGSAASRTIARVDNCSQLRATPFDVVAKEGRPICRPSIWPLVISESPSSLSIRSSFMELM